jgi:hypothetical protein
MIPYLRPLRRISDGGKGGFLTGSPTRALFAGSERSLRLTDTGGKGPAMLSSYPVACPHEGCKLERESDPFSGSGRRRCGGRNQAASVVSLPALRARLGSAHQ